MKVKGTIGLMFMSFIFSVSILSSSVWLVYGTEERKPGVKVDDWVKYGWDITHVTEYPEWWGIILDWSRGSEIHSDDMDWTMNNVSSVWQIDHPSGVEGVGGGVQFCMKIKLRNGTAITLEGLIAYVGFEPSQRANMTMPLPSFWFIAANLSAYDMVYLNKGHTWVNETISRTYLGIARQTNHLEMTQHWEGEFEGIIDPTAHFNLYYDKETGILCEYNKAIYNLTYHGNTKSIRILDTNLWGDKTPPVANAGSNRTLEVGASITFDGSSSRDDIGIVKYEWVFGDGNYGTGKTVIHIYSSIGTFEVTLTVEDAAGNNDTDTIFVTVKEATSEGLPLWIYGIIMALIVIIVLFGIVIWRQRKYKVSSKEE